MTRDEAFEWLESRVPEREDFCIEYFGRGTWTAYQWFGAAGDDEYPHKEGTFIECVEYMKRFVAARSALAVKHPSAGEKP